MPNKVDITGLLAKPKPDWQERVEELARPEWFNGYTPKQELLNRLTSVERERLVNKLALVKQAAAWMAAGMLKGTLKYATDDYSIDQWMAHVVGEGADQINYQLLLFDAYWRNKNSAPQV